MEGKGGAGLFVPRVRSESGTGDRTGGALQSRLRGAPVGRRCGTGGEGGGRSERRTGVVHACPDLVGFGLGIDHMGPEERVKKGTGSVACSAPATMPSCPFL